ncbi:MAG: hypothetical protein CMJ83_15780 [Planctomycetes bacterium]|nr:hypothetical protein [Planctomycetota bacterium]
MSEAKERDESKRPRWLRRLLTRFAVLALALFVVAVAAEIGLRMVDEFPPVVRTYVGEHEDRESERFVPDEQIGWRMKGDVRFTATTEGRKVLYVADRDGFRVGTTPDRYAAVRKHSVAIVGDSFVWGFGVPYQKTLPALLQRLNARVRVRTFGLPGFGLDQIALCLEDRALPWKAKLVIVGLVLDDFDRSFDAFRRTEGFNKPCFVMDAGRLRRRTADDRPGALGDWLQNRSRLYGIGVRARRTLARRHGTGQWWALNAALLDRMIKAGKDAGVPLVFVHIPASTGEAFPALIEHLEAAGQPLIDLRDAPNLGSFFFKIDGHLNDRGHEMMAVYLSEWLLYHHRELYR